MSNALVAALISASVSLVIFTVAKWWEYRVSQTAFLRTKLEELFCSLEPIYEFARMPSIGSQDSENDRDRFGLMMVDQAGNLARSLSRPHMLSNLYFEDVVPRFERMAEELGKLNEWMHDYADPNTPYEIEEGIIRFKCLNSSISEIKKYLKNEQKTLIKQIGYSFLM